MTYQINATKNEEKLNAKISFNAYKNENKREERKNALYSDISI